MSNPNTVVRYVKATQSGSGPRVAMQEDLPKMIVPREAAFPVEYGVTGRELRAKLTWAIEQFVRAMELQGLTLVPLPTGNPLVVTEEDGTPYGTYSITKDLMKAAPDEMIDHETDGRGPETLKQPRSLEDSEGFIDYRIVGVFWAPQVSVEIAVDRARILEGERQAKNPRTWRPGSTTPDTPSLA
jgi:hypothetical protein